MKREAGSSTSKSTAWEKIGVWPIRPATIHTIATEYTATYGDHEKRRRRLPTRGDEAM
jgi:hypothetical protein